MEVAVLARTDLPQVQKDGCMILTDEKALRILQNKQRPDESRPIAMFSFRYKTDTVEKLRFWAQYRKGMVIPEDFIDVRLVSSYLCNTPRGDAIMKDLKYT